MEDAGGSSEDGGSRSRPEDEQSTRHMEEVPVSTAHVHWGVRHGRQPVKADTANDGTTTSHRSRRCVVTATCRHLHFQQFELRCPIPNGLSASISIHSHYCIICHLSTIMRPLTVKHSLYNDADDYNDDDDDDDAWQQQQYTGDW